MKESVSPKNLASNFTFVMEELRVKENALPTTSLTRVEHYIATYSTKTNLRRTLKDVIYQEGVYGLIVQIGCIY